MWLFIVLLIVVSSPYSFSEQEGEVIDWMPIGTTKTYTHRWFMYDCDCDNICGPVFMRQISANDGGHGSDTFQEWCPAGGKCSCTRVNVIRGQPDACNPCKPLGPPM